LEIYQNEYIRLYVLEVGGIMFFGTAEDWATINVSL